MKRLLTALFCLWNKDDLYYDDSSWQIGKVPLGVAMTTILVKKIVNK